MISNHEREFGVVLLIHVLYKSQIILLIYTYLGHFASEYLVTLIVTNRPLLNFFHEIRL